MATPPKMYGTTLIDQFVARTQLAWIQFIVIVCGLFIGGLGAASYLDRDFKVFTDIDLVRVYLTSPAVILYILLAYYNLGVKSSGAALRALQQLMGLEHATFSKLLTPEAMSYRRQWTALGAGIGFGLIMSPPWQTIAPFTWLNLYLWVNQITMMGLLGFIIYLATAESALINKLQQHPLHFDVFDMTLFEELGRSRFVSTLIMIGGSTLVVIMLPTRFLMNVFTIALLVGIGLVSVAAFFLNLRSTHRVMLEAKQRELKAVREKMRTLFDDLKAHRVVENPETAHVWLLYEKRIQQAPEWPFNTETLRNLIFSVFVPAAAFLARWILGRIDF